MPRYRSMIADSVRWERFSLRSGDVLVCTPAKAGTTWMQTIACLLVHDTTALDTPLTVLSPWLENQTESIEDVAARLEGQQHRRVVKSHTPLDGLPDRDDVVHLHVIRHPLSAALSWFDHVANADIERMFELRADAVGLDDLAELGTTPAEDPNDSRSLIRRWIDAPPLDTPSGPSMASLHEYVHHAATFWARRDRPNVHLFHYDRMVADLAGQMRRVASALEIEPGPSFDAQVAAAEFGAMRSRAADLAPDGDRGMWRSNEEFFRAGASRRWQDHVSDDDVAAFEARMALLATPALARWICDATGPDDHPDSPGDAP